MFKSSTNFIINGLEEKDINFDFSNYNQDVVCVLSIKNSKFKTYCTYCFCNFHLCRKIFFRKENCFNMYKIIIENNINHKQYKMFITSNFENKLILLPIGLYEIKFFTPNKILNFAFELIQPKTIVKLEFEF